MNRAACTPFFGPITRFLTPAQKQAPVGGTGAIGELSQVPALMVPAGVNQDRKVGVLPVLATSFLPSRLSAERHQRGKQLVHCNRPAANWKMELKKSCPPNVSNVTYSIKPNTSVLVEHINLETEVGASGANRGSAASLRPCKATCPTARRPVPDSGCRPAEYH
jgi:hypothetical protein